MDALEEFAKAKFNINGIQYLPINYKYDNFTEVAVIKGEKDYEGDITIPNKIRCLGGYYEVTKIGENAFENCKKLTSIKLSKGLKMICTAAFRGCSELSTITIPSEVEGICDNAFENCTSLQSIKLPRNIKAIGARAFAGCSNISSIKIPKSVELLGYEVFASCTSLNSIKLPLELKKLGADVLIDTLLWSKLPNGVVYKNDYLLGYKKAAPCHLNIRPGTRLIADRAFIHSESLQSIECSQELEHIGESAFEYCKNLDSVIFNEKLKDIDNNAFCKCINLSSVVFGNHLESLGDNAFKDCTALQSLNLPTNITRFGSNAFLNTELWNTMPEGLVYMGHYLLGWKGEKPTHIEVKEGTTLIANETFLGTSKLKNVMLPTTLKFIGDRAFSQSKLKEIHIPEGVLEIGICAFDRCYDLKEISLPSTLKTLNVASFLLTDNLSSITIHATTPPIVIDNMRIAGIKSGQELYVGPHYQERILYVPLGAKSAYANTTYWKNFKNIIEISMD